MASFTDDEKDRHELDWEMLRDGGITLYLKPEVLQADLEWLGASGYEIKEMNCESWRSEESMHDAVASTLSFPRYYGRNFNALNDCISEDLEVPTQGGLAVVLRHFDQFATTSAEAMLHIFAKASRHHMLSGKRLVILIQSDDPRMRYDGLAAVQASWNKREWLIKARGL